MGIGQAVVLGLLQGATEFLPISSSGHLVLVPWLLGWPSPGLAFSALVHWATALAVLGYFYQEWHLLIRAATRDILALCWRRRRECSKTALISGETRYLGLIFLGTVPAAVIGGLFNDFFETVFARPLTVSAFLLLTAGLLTVGERLGRQENNLKTLTWRDALWIGVGQALAIFPGLSRSGTTIAVGLVRGLSREEATRFSFLLATPIIIGAGFAELADLVQAGELASQVAVLAVGFLAAIGAGLVSVYLLLRLVPRRPLYGFAIYCALFGLLGLVVAGVRGG